MEKSNISNSIVSGTFSKLRDDLATNQLSTSKDSVDAAVAVLLHELIDNDLEVLLIHRADRPDDPWSGQIGLPGGRLRKSDPSTRDALRREVEEEVGFDVDAEGHELGQLSISSPMRNLDIKVQPWVIGLRRRPHIIVGQEIQQAFWVSLTTLPSARRKVEIEIRGVKREVDAFFVYGKVVWGFTHRVLNELLWILGLLNPD